jgi:hypothetical protein
MSNNRYLPLWLHRICNGLFASALLAGLGTFCIGEPAGSWRHIVSACLVWSSIPIGIVLAVVAHHFSIVEGLADDVGYEEDNISVTQTLNPTD